jgi:hexosaminidase
MTSHGSSDPVPAIIPAPVRCAMGAGEFVLSPGTVIVADEELESTAGFLRNLLALPSGFPLPIQTSAAAKAPAIQLKIAPQRTALGEEGYRLEVSTRGVDIEAPGRAGVFYAIQTLRQLLPIAVEQRSLVSHVAWRIPCIVVEDAPRFPWRGFMMDEARHFHGKQSMLRTLELMSLHKLNVMHWHLTDDQGWRIEIARHPRLTEVGAQRSGTARGFLGRCDGVAHAGFYTKREIAEIVGYANKRHITIVPEIEMPGHSMAALAAYPHLSCTGSPFEVSWRFGPSLELYCAGKDEVFAFLEDVLDEVMALFPSPYIHIGGDEAPRKRWRDCPDCRERMRREGLQDFHQLQVYFTNRIAAYLESHGRCPVGWNEVLGEGLAESVMLQYWLGKRLPIMHAMREGRRVIMSSYLHTYLDHSHSLTSLRKAYAYKPLWRELDASQAGNVLGLEAPLWTEFVPSRERQDFQTYPRLTAFAETGWSPRGKKDFSDFQRRLGAFLSRLDALGVGYARGRDAEPPWCRQMLGALTIAQTQRKTASKPGEV